MSSILKVKDLKVVFDRDGEAHEVVRGISFEVEKNSVFGIIGESGSGKTMTALSILKLIYPPGRIERGEIFFNGEDLLKMGEGSLRAIRGGRIAMVFQEPASALNPVLTMGEQLIEAVRAHNEADHALAARIAKDHLRRVHIPDPERVYHAYPHQLSGGLKQRAMIAMALVNSPDLLILDEPTTALDVTVQAQILALLQEIIGRQNISVIFISHNFAVISKMCGRVAVMNQGSIVETGPVDTILSHPKEDYTKRLIESARLLA